MNINNFLTPHVPVLFYGHPGVGKTEKIKKCFDHVEVMLASSMVEEDIGGIPYREGIWDKRTIPIVIKNLEEAHQQGKKTAIFFDELDKARRSVADTLLTFICNRAIGAAKLPATTCIIAAANHEISGGDGISDAMQSRFCCIEFLPDPVEWYDWASQAYAHHLDKLEPVLQDIRKSHIPLYNITGEGQHRRITCPRTISLFLTYFCKSNPSMADQQKFIHGLICSSEATKILHLLNADQDSNLNKIFKLERKIIDKNKVIPPVRL